MGFSNITSLSDLISAGYNANLKMYFLSSRKLELNNIAMQIAQQLCECVRGGAGAMIPQRGGLDEPLLPHELPENCSERTPIVLDGLSMEARVEVLNHELKRLKEEEKLIDFQMDKVRIEGEASRLLMEEIRKFGIGSAFKNMYTATA